MPKIFISYSRRDKVPVFQLKDEIESVVGKGSCWIDLTGIESDREFVDVIIDAIDRADIFLFMYSRNSDGSCWTRKEVEYAAGEHKRIVFVRIDSEPLGKYYRFQFAGHDIIDLQDEAQKQKLLRDLEEWTGSRHRPALGESEMENHRPGSPRHQAASRLDSFWLSPQLHPVINMGITLQLCLYCLALCMLLWTFAGGCLAFYQHPQVSHVMLILALCASILATCKLHKLRSCWYALVFALDFVEIYLVSHLAKFLYHNWHLYSRLSYPTSIRYQLLFSLGADMRHHRIAGTSTWLVVLAMAHIAIVCLALFTRKDGKSAWERMR